MEKKNVFFVKSIFFSFSAGDLKDQVGNKNETWTPSVFSEQQKRVGAAAHLQLSLDLTHGF